MYDVWYYYNMYPKSFKCFLCPPKCSEFSAFSHQEIIITTQQLLPIEYFGWLLVSQVNNERKVKVFWVRITIWIQSTWYIICNIYIQYTRQHRTQVNEEYIRFCFSCVSILYFILQHLCIVYCQLSTLRTCL